MAAFAYTAADKTGASKKGVIEATSAAAARAMLREQGLLPLAVDAASERRSIGSIKLPAFGRSGMSARELATATRQIATLVGSDIPVEEALRLAASQSEAQRVSSILLEVRAAILDGRSFANALGTHPKTFPEF
jgi:general secretion pathway protein F